MKHWTDQTDNEAVPFFDSLPIREIRKRQALCREQQALAVKQGKDDALADLQRMEKALFDSMMRRT